MIRSVLIPKTQLYKNFDYQRIFMRCQDIEKAGRYVLVDINTESITREKCILNDLFVFSPSINLNGIFVSTINQNDIKEELTIFHGSYLNDHTHKNVLDYLNEINNLSISYSADYKKCMIYFDIEDIDFKYPCFTPIDFTNTIKGSLGDRKIII